jgi:hypothetical protein
MVKVIFGDNSKGKIIRVGNIGSKSSPSIEKLFLVNNLKHNLLSISELYDKGYKIKFDHICCLILENDKVLDSACSRHMTRDDSLFSSISKINGESHIWRQLKRKDH